MIKELRPALILLIALTLLTGLAYPLAMTGMAASHLSLSVAGQPDQARRESYRI